MDVALVYPVSLDKILVQQVAVQVNIVHLLALQAEEMGMRLF